jgi:hypothetical protein
MIGKGFLSLAAVVALFSCLSGGPVFGGPVTIKFRTDRAGLVSINIYDARGALVRALLSNVRMGAGEHAVAWDGRSAASADGGREELPGGEYIWRGILHEAVGLKLRGWVGSGAGVPWRTADGKEGWGGDSGVPSAVAADEKKVYLGWTLANAGKSVLACDLEGKVVWAHRRTEGPSGCRALGVDDGLVYVLGGLAGTGAQGGSIYRLKAGDGSVVPWPSGAVDLKISTFWPANSRDKPDEADAMAVRHGRIYLSFTSSQFLTVLDAKTGEYIQTVVGAPPGMIDVAPTKTELPDAPGKLSDADFGVVSLGGGVLGRILFAHDPFWVITSDLAPLDRDVSITALTVIGDGAKHHMHTAFVGFGAPFHQIQARPLLDIENPSWVAGHNGGRSALGPWQADGFRSIRGVALAADGRLWVAEGDGFPKRFSVWDTNGTVGKLLREYFGPAYPSGRDAAINPLNADLVFAQGCEWRIDAKTGRASCLGVVTHDNADAARFGVGDNGHAYLITARGKELPALSVFERLGDGNYSLRARIFPADNDGMEVLEGAKELATQTVFWSDENGDGKVDPAELHAVPEVIRFRPEWTGQDLSLQGFTEGTRGGSWHFKPIDWTACAAPRYESGRTVAPNGEGELSADGRFVLAVRNVGADSTLECKDTAEGHTQWTIASMAGDEAPMGAALLPPPLGNVWIVASAKGPWRLVNADGFELGNVLEAEPEKVRWPKTAAPGADMTHASGNSNFGSLARTVDGKLYLQVGDSAYWSLEVTGLDQVKPLPGGKLTVPPTK